MSEKKESLLARLTHYMGRLKGVYILSMVLASLGALLSMLSLIAVWLLVQRLLSPDRAFFASWSSTSLAWGIFALAAGGILFYFFSLWCSHVSAFRLERSIRFRAMKKVIQMPLGFFSDEDSGKMRKVFDDNASITHTFVAHQMPDIFVGVVCLISAFVFLFVADWRMGLVSLFPVLVSILVFMSFMGPSYKTTMQTYMNCLEEMNNEAVEYVRGIPVVKVFQQTVYSFKRFYRIIMQYNEWASEYTVQCRRGMIIYSIASTSFAFLLVPLSIYLISRGEDWRMVSVNLTFYMLITPFFSQSLMKLMHMIAGVNQADEALSRIDKLLDEGKKLPQTDEAYSGTLGVGIGIHDVHFRYGAEEKEVLRGINLEIPPNAKIALVGPSGGGKTTLASLIARFWDVCEGSITVGGVDIRQVSQQQLMKHISFVFQHSTLFKTSVRENLIYGKEDAGEEEILRALTLAQAKEVVDKLPNGLDTIIGTEGTYLSGGEQQRIILARAFLKDAPILLLDEATAFADPENEKEIQKALRRLMEGKTVVMIAHRLSSIKDVDEIVVIKEGQVAERGTHDALLANKSVYADMWNNYCRAAEWKIGKEDSK